MATYKQQLNNSHISKRTHVTGRPCFEKYTSCKGGSQTNFRLLFFLFFTSQVSIEAEGGTGKWRVGATVGNSLSCEVTQVLKMFPFIFYQKCKNARKYMFYPYYEINSTTQDGKKFTSGPVISTRMMAPPHLQASIIIAFF